MNGAEYRDKPNKTPLEARIFQYTVHERNSDTVVGKIERRGSAFVAFSYDGEHGNGSVWMMTDPNDPARAAWFSSAQYALEAIEDYREEQRV